MKIEYKVTVGGSILCGWLAELTWRHKGPCHADLCNPFTLDVDLCVMFLDGINVRPFQKAKTDACVFVVEQVDMANSKFVSRSHT